MQTLFPPCLKKYCQVTMATVCPMLVLNVSKGKDGLVWMLCLVSRDSCDSTLYIFKVFLYNKSFTKAKYVACQKYICFRWGNVMFSVRLGWILYLENKDKNTNYSFSDTLDKCYEKCLIWCEYPLWWKLLVFFHVSLWHFSHDDGHIWRKWSSKLHLSVFVVTKINCCMLRNDVKVFGVWSLINPKQNKHIFFWF